MLDYEYHFEVFRRFVTDLAAGLHSGTDGDKNIYLRRRGAPTARHSG